VTLVISKKNEVSPTRRSYALIFFPALFDGESNSYSRIGAFQAIQTIPHFIYKSAVGQIRLGMRGILSQVLGMGAPPVFHTAAAFDVRQTLRCCGSCNMRDSACDIFPVDAYT
jgi:hypothetical protein